MALRNVRTGVSPVDRPTEWTSALIMLILAAVAWNSDHDTAALLAVVGAALPVLITALTAWWESRHSTTTTEPTPVVGSE